MSAKRQALPFIVVGGAFLVFAAWLYLRPRLSPRDPYGCMGPTICLTAKQPENGYALQQYDRRAIATGMPILFLPPSHQEAMFIVLDKGSQSTAYPSFIMREGGAPKTLTSITVAGASFSIPIGVDRLLATIEVIIGVFPFCFRFWKRKRQTKDAQQGEEADAE